MGVIIAGIISSNGQSNYIIPVQTINPCKLIESDGSCKDTTVSSFEISEFITYGEYKIYLNAVKKDSSQKYYLTQLPDSNISSNSGVYSQYVNSTKFDNYPVLGISWDNAMNFCRWKTFQENPIDSLQFIYRLPSLIEWLSTYTYLNSTHAKVEINNLYSDWLLNSKMEYDYNFPHTTYFHKAKDAPVIKRKMVIGSSFLFQRKKFIDYFFSYYATEGYRQISFRIVKQPINMTDKHSLGKEIIKYWGLLK